ncbi:hypothetical protein ONZ43_g4629 [Nemania bipapillata]|uniref:Uncharacterized protein n=1 Tax=Nemania bipapillata TaxID=110536 RepID=A0ACC2IKK2_9PEZI|nr:hypothetical protein ONZ43_g4629 [Nemania bipapillata]
MRSFIPVALALPAAFTHPLKSRDAPEFVITDLGATFPYPQGPYGVPSVNSNLVISVTYPDPSSTTGATLSTTCSLNWPKGTDPAPTEWTPCADPALQFRLPADGWTSTTNFTVELWETLTASGNGLEGSQLIVDDPANPSDPDAYIFCLQKGKFNPLTCTLTGPFGQTQRTVVIPAAEESSRPA